MTDGAARELITIAARKLRRGSDAEAASMLTAALEIAPDDPTALLLLAECHLRAERSSAAIGLLRRGLARAPGEDEFLRALARAYDMSGAFDEAAGVLEQVVKGRPGDSSFLHAHALALRRAGRMEEALPVLDAAIASAPDLPGPKFTKATTNLTLGRWAEGWADFDARDAFSKMPTPPNLPRWDGSPAPDKRLLVVSEGGHGDIVWATRFLPWIKPMVARVEFVVVQGLHQLLAGIDGVDAMQTSASASAFDLYIPLQSLPVLLGVSDPAKYPPTRLSTTPTERVAALMERAGARARVGIIWSGNENYAENRERAAPLEVFFPLLEDGQVQLFSLQKGKQQAVLREAGLGDLIIDTDDFDFAETAALIEALDLMIMTDTAVCHIAGSLGKPVWLMLDTAPFWLWGMSGETSPWYPSMRLFRQDRPRDWSGVMARVVAELRAIFPPEN